MDLPLHSCAVQRVLNGAAMLANIYPLCVVIAQKCSTAVTVFYIYLRAEIPQGTDCVTRVKCR